MTTDYMVQFYIKGSSLTLEEFVDHFHKQVGPKAESVYIEARTKDVHFWQANRRCDCGSHFWENGLTVDFVKCSKCGKEVHIQ